MAKNDFKWIFMSDENFLFNAEQVSRSILAQLSKGTTHDGKRNLYDIFGYRDEINPDDYRFRYERGNIASRVCNAFPDAVWGNPPTMHEDDEESEKRTNREAKFDAIVKRVNLWHYFYRADVLAQLGRYSVLFCGIADGATDLSQPAGRGELIYLMPFGESNAEIESTDADPFSPRFGKPDYYNITIDTEDDDSTMLVHHSRCIHIAERTLDNDNYGSSALKAIFNVLDDLDKVVGGGGEMWWLNGRGGLNLNAGENVDIVNTKDLQEQAENFVHGLTRLLKTKGVDAKILQGQISNPAPYFDMYISLIAGTTGIPQRILIGSERGELASTQDENNFNSRISERRDNFVTGAFLSPLINLLENIGEIEEGNDEVTWSWGSQDMLAKDKQALVATQMATAIATYTNALGADQIIPPEQFVEKVLQMTYQENEIAEQLSEEDAELARLDRQLETERQQNDPAATDLPE